MSKFILFKNILIDIKYIDLIDGDQCSVDW
jgi:hypothetical protein